MEFFYVVKATQKSGKPDAVVWFTAKTEARANLQLDVELEDANIETGRGKDYQKPIRTDFPVFNDLPEESTVDLTWCERYELAEDMRTWQLKPSSKPDDAFHNESTPAAAVDATAPTDANAVTTMQETEKEAVDLFAYGKFPYEKRVLGTWLYGLFDSLTTEQLQEITRVELDMDETYAQNVLLAARDFKTRPIEHVFPETLADLFTATKSIWPVDGKAPMLNDLITFFAEWLNTHQSDRVSRDDVTAKWFAKHRKAPAVETKSAPEPVQTKERYKRAVPQSTAGLRNEIAIAQLYPDAEPGKISRPQLTGAKHLQEREEAVFITASKTLMGITDILDYDTQTVFGVTHAIKWNDEKSVKELRQQARSWLAENGIYETGEPSNGYAEWSTESREQSEKEDSVPATQPENQLEVKNHGAGIFSVEELMTNSKLYGNKSETTSNGQMETTEQPQAENSAALPAGEGTVEDDSQADTVTETVCTGCGAIGGGHCPDCGAVTGDATYAAMESGLKEELDTLEHDSNKQETPAAAAPSHPDNTAQDLVPMETASTPEDPQAEPAIEYPAFFEPGRYEGLPNEVYHAANGISSTQVKDARVSLMYYHGRHITKTIRRESSDALTFGSLAHTMALEPEKLDEEFAVFPGVPAEAFTTTDSLKAFIRDYNVDKPKSEQLKLTGKKEDLQEAIRAVNPSAIFADEFEQQWRESVAGKTILTTEQLELATAIQQSLFSNSDAHSLLCNPGRQSEVSYFGIDEETGLEIRVRPDIELRTPTENICADLKTVSIGNVRQDRIKERLHREIIERDYHLSAAMYCDVAGLDSFSWIFVNKEPGYHWVAVVQASETELELGRQEYRRVLRQMNEAMENDVWPAPVVGTYTDELNDYDLRRLQALAEE